MNDFSIIKLIVFCVNKFYLTRKFDNNSFFSINMYENIDHFPFRYLDMIDFFSSDFGVSLRLESGL